MRIILKAGLLALVPETNGERSEILDWQFAMAGHVLTVLGVGSKGISLHDLGPKDEACREPINVVFDHADRWQPISNLAETPFVLRGRTYASVESFSQGLKFDSDTGRLRIAKLWGNEAKTAARGHGEPDNFMFDGRVVVAGSAAHRRLMLEACRAKFSQSILARNALLATGERPLMHRTMRQIGFAFGIALIGALLQRDDSNAYATAFAVIAACSLGLAGLTFSLLSRANG